MEVLVSNMGKECKLKTSEAKICLLKSIAVVVKLTMERLGKSQQLKVVRVKL